MKPLIAIAEQASVAGSNAAHAPLAITQVVSVIPEKHSVTVA